MIYITGDTHGKFERIEQFCGKFKTSREDVLIILGDAGINFSGWVKDHVKKEFLETLPITFFCIHGNHEQRPQTIGSYREKLWRGGVVYYEEEYPDLLFAKDGEVFDFNGKQTIVTGGAYSVDRMYRLIHGYGWWPDEQPSEEIKQDVERKLDELSWNVDVVLSHTVPLKYEPTEVFLEGLDQSKVDRTTEKWLDKIEDRLNYQKWYCGHYHTEKKVDKIEIMFENIEKFDLYIFPLRKRFLFLSISGIISQRVFSFNKNGCKSISAVKVDIKRQFLYIKCYKLILKMRYDDSIMKYVWVLKN